MRPDSAATAAAATEAGPQQEQALAGILTPEQMVAFRQKQEEDLDGDPENAKAFQRLHQQMDAGASSQPKP